MDETETQRSLVTQQQVADEKQELARRMRRAMTPAEAGLWEGLRAGRMGGAHFRRQQVIDGFIVDFYCHRAGLVVEVDGAGHRAGQQVKYDVERDRILRQRGLSVLRVTNAEVETDMDRVLVKIRQALAL